MGATAIGIVFSDVDGTLVGDDHHPLADTAPVMREVAARVPVCLVSARSPEGLYPIHEQLGFSGPIACYSGAYVLDADGTELFSKTISVSEAVGIKEYLSSELPHLTVGAYGFHDWVVDDRSDPNIQREEYLVQAQSRECSDLALAFGKCGMHKFLLMGQPNEILEAERTVSERYPHLNVVRSSDILCEVMAGGASKSNAVRLVCERYGVGLDQAVAFGDGHNDLDMLLEVRQSYAMANAEPEVKAAATHVIPWTNAQGGVAHTLEQLVLAQG